MYPTPDISINFDEKTKELLERLVHHRETLLEQLRFTFGEVKQNPCHEAHGELKGFEILLQDWFINEAGDYDILMKFATDKYGLQLRVTAGQQKPLYTWMYWEKDLTMRRSRRFIETVYTFLINFNRIQPREDDEMVSSNDIRNYWDKLVDAIPQSI